MVKMQTSTVPYDLFRLIVVFISFVKCDEDLLIFNCIIVREYSIYCFCFYLLKQERDLDYNRQF